MDLNTRFALGSVLAGSLISTSLFGVLCLQMFLYVTQYWNDPTHLKALVILVWALDTLQTCCIISSAFQYLIINFMRPDIVDHIFMSVVVAMALTTLLTFIVNGFFAYKVHRLSGGNMWLTMTTAICMILRLSIAFITLVKLAELRSFRLYAQSYKPLLTAGLALSAFTDMIITGGLCYYLRALNPDLYRTKKMMSTLVSFADNNGALTCIVALSSLIFWITMPSKLIYLAFHFAIGKCYSNSLLATLNMRNYVKRAASTPAEVINIMNPISALPPKQRASAMRSRPNCIGADVYNDECQAKEEASEGTLAALEIKVDRIVHFV